VALGSSGLTVRTQYTYIGAMSRGVSELPRISRQDGGGASDPDTLAHETIVPRPLTTATT
jgi:hypothetical protein